MKISWKGFLALLFMLVAGLRGTAQAGQQIYLSESPNGKYRVTIEQSIDRRVGDKVFFRYSLDLANVRNNKHHFEILQGGSPLVHETEKGTFQVHPEPNPVPTPEHQRDMFDDHWASIRFSWSRDSLKLFVRLEVIEGTWRTYFVDINSGKTTDITPDLEGGIKGKIGARKWDCQQPKVELALWTKPHLAFFKLTSICGKDKEKENDKLFNLTDSVLFDTVKGMVVSHCLDCKNEKSLKTFDKYFISTIPTPTPTPEETPTTP